MVVTKARRLTYILQAVETIIRWPYEQDYNKHPYKSVMT